MKAKALTSRQLIHVLASGIHDDHLLPRFMEKFTKTEDGCWQWRGAISTGGYGLFNVQACMLYAHRVAYAILRGDIPDEMQIDHLCRNTRCVNPDHLEVVTPRTNVHRSSGPTAINASKTECVRGHAFDEENTVVERSGSRRCRQCGDESRRRRSARRVECADCGLNVRQSSLSVHRARKHRPSGESTS